MAGHILIPAQKSRCQLTGTALNDTATLDYGIRCVAVSPSGRYFYICAFNSITVIDSIYGTEQIYPHGFFDELDEIACSLILTSERAGYIIHALAPSGFSIKYVTFGDSANGLVLSVAASPAFNGYEYESSFTYTEGIGVFFQKKLDGRCEICCFLFEYDGGLWTKEQELPFGDCLHLDRKLFIHYPTCFDGHLYTLVSIYGLGQTMRGCLKSFGELCQVNVDTKKRQILKTVNDLQCLNLHERILDRHVSVGLQLSMTNQHTWKGADLFLSWGINNANFDNGCIHRNQINYMATFNLHTLVWRPIQIEGLTRVIKDIPLQMQVSEDNVMTLVKLKKSDAQPTTIQTWHIPIPTRNPTRLSCLARLAFLNKPAASGLISANKSLEALIVS